MFIKRNIILFGAFLSAFILLLVPNIGCINSIVPNVEISNFMNIRIEVLKKTESILNSDCGCEDSKTTNSHNYTIICYILYSIFAYLGAFLYYCVVYDHDFLFNVTQSLAGAIYKMGELFNCSWYYPIK